MRTKLSKDQIATISKKNLLRIIGLAKHHLKKSLVVQDMFSVYDVPLDYIDDIAVAFDDIDVSAKTIKGCVYLSFRLLESSDFITEISVYMVHEFDHVLRQIMSDKATKNTDKEDGENYLLSSEEREAFKVQIDYMEDELGEMKANDYVEHLLDYHDINDSKTRRETKEDLLD